MIQVWHLFNYERMKRILATQKFTITTHLVPNKVEDKLLNFVELHKSANFLKFDFSVNPSSDKPYQGTVENGFFKIRKISVRRNKGSLPIIQGSISGQDREGSLIEVKIEADKKFNDGMVLFAFVMTPIAIIHFFCFLANAAENDVAGSIIFFVSPIFMCIVYFTIIKNFEDDLKRDKQFLMEIFK